MVPELGGLEPTPLLNLQSRELSYAFPPLPPGLEGISAGPRGKGKGGDHQQLPWQAANLKGRLAKAEAIALSGARSRLGRELVQKGYYSESSRRSRHAVRSDFCT